MCQNHHTQLDIGGMVILNDLTVAKTSDLNPFADLTFRKEHKLDISNAKYHRAQWGFA